jgi:ferrochelatase
MTRKVAVVLLNLGGPDRQESVRPFLFNLFADKAIIRLPWPARMALATLISTTRARSARANYALMGGGSPLLAETRKQADALQTRLSAELAGDEVRTFIAMRYWNPLTAEAAREVANFAPDEVVLLPLYPQYSTTTTESSVNAWRAAYRGSGVVRTVCCYPGVASLAKAHAVSIRQTWERAGRPEGLRLLFSAHGLPQQVVDDGDPYAMQVEKTCAAVLEQLGADGLGQGWDWRLAYQSRVGRLKWLGPYTPQAIADAAEEGRGLIVVPIAFVSEHVETLVELDIEYRELAEHAGVEPYLRVPALGVQSDFIDTLTTATLGAMKRPGVAPAGSPCDGNWRRCALKQGQAA